MATPTSPAASAPASSQPASPQNGAVSQSQNVATPAAEVRKLKLKLDGQDVEMPESEVIALAQQGKTSAKRFQEASQLKRQAEEILKAVEENPGEFLTKKGKNIRDWAEDFLVNELKKESMSPEQRRAAENEIKIKEYETEKKQAADAKRKQEMDDLQAHHAENYNKLFVDALSKSGLPKTAYTVKRMAELQLVNIKKKLELNPDQLAKVVREDYMAEQKSLFGAYDGDQLLEALGPELVKKLSKAQIAKLKAKGVRTSSAGSSARSSSNSGEQLTWQEYQRRNRRKP